MKLFFGLLCLLVALVAQAAPPYDVTVTFTPPSTGGAPDGFNLYVDDCAVSGPLGAATGSVVSGQTFPSLILADGTYQFCVRAFNAAGENPDPGQVATAIIADLPLPGPVNNLGIQVMCPSSSCTISVTVN
jgi:hypothetical protein